ncbi:sperm surface protein Sp17 isoform X2 [Stegostoma tigrinum]|uniref:sperm surface protein Sp17 isoform X2 n=1 Tax=Stegostoma tigrinum TaxID=3053191 RepID=UPI00202B859F|nr:sperm surface protein Sp17 isoform X2 [Stegostoma tigrinum]
MSVPFSNTTLRIPRGFGNLLEGLSREVLRHQPDDIIEFAAVYFEDLLEKREATGIDPADWAAKLEDRFYNNHVFKEVRKSIPADEEKQPPITIDTAYQEKDLTVTDNPEDSEGSQRKCIKVPKDLSFISKETISMILEDSFLKSSKHAPPGVEDVRDTLATPESEKGPQEDTSIQVVEASPIEGQSEVIFPLMIEAAPEEDQGEVTSPLMIEAAPEEGQGEVTSPVMIEAAPEEGQGEVTSLVMVEAAPEEGQGEVASPLMIEAAPEEVLKMEEISQIIEGAPEAALPMETPRTEEAEEQTQPPEEHPVVGEVNPEEEHAATLIQSTFRGYSTRKKLKEDQPDPTEADNDLFVDGSEYSSGEELTLAEEENTRLETVGVILEEPMSELEGNGSTAKVDSAQINVCAVELSPMLDKVNSEADVDICGAELQPNANEDNKSESDTTTEAAGQNIYGTELDQKNLFEPTPNVAANVDIHDTELEGLVAEKDSNDTEEVTEIKIDSPGEPNDQVTDKVVSQGEVGESKTAENPQDQEDKSLKSTKDIEAESEFTADTKGIENPPTAENQDCEGGSSTLE